MVLERIKHTKQNDKNRKSRRGEEEEKRKHVNTRKQSWNTRKKKKSVIEYVCVCLRVSLVAFVCAAEPKTA